MRLLLLTLAAAMTLTGCPSKTPPDAEADEADEPDEPDEAPAQPAGIAPVRQTRERVRGIEAKLEGKAQRAMDTGE